jgi:hypothetical protein
MNMIGEANASAQRRVALASMAGALCLGLWIVYTIPASFLPACLFHSLTGHSCLTCGMTRSLHAMAHGHLGASVRYHLFGPIVFMGMLFCLSGFGMEAVSGRKIFPGIRRKLWRPILATTAFVWLSYWLVRILME